MRNYFCHGIFLTVLRREKDDETPNLNVLLCEIFVAVYMSLLSYALSSCDAQILYRLVSQRIGSGYWSHLFGGGAKRVIKVETSHSPLVKELSVSCLLLRTQIFILKKKHLKFRSE